MTTPPNLHVIKAYNPGNLTANTDNALIDYQTAVTAVLPSGSMIYDVFLHMDSALTNGATLSVGTAANNQLLLPSAQGVTTNNVNANDVMYSPVGPKLSTTADSDIVVNPGGVTVSGQLDVLVYYVSYNDVS